MKDSYLNYFAQLYSSKDFFQSRIAKGYSDCTFKDSFWMFNVIVPYILKRLHYKTLKQYIN